MTEISEKEVRAVADVLLGRVNAPEQEIYRAARDALEAAARVREEANAEGVPGCMDCGLPYIDDRFQDLFVPNHVWQKIAPDDGLLCPNCLCGRVAKLGIECQATFHSGPFRTQPFPQSSEKPRAYIMRTDAAMLESLAGTFRLLRDGGPFVCSFNFDDVACLLERAAEEIRPSPELASGRAARSLVKGGGDAE